MIKIAIFTYNGDEIVLFPDNVGTLITQSHLTVAHLPHAP